MDNATKPTPSEAMSDEAIIQSRPIRAAIKYVLGNQTSIFEVLSVVVVGAGALMIQVGLFEAVSGTSPWGNGWVKLGMLSVAFGLLLGGIIFPVVAFWIAYKAARFRVALTNIDHQGYLLGQRIIKAAALAEPDQAEELDSITAEQVAWGERVIKLLLKNHQEALMSLFLSDVPTPPRAFGLPPKLEDLAHRLAESRMNLREIILRML